MNEKLTDITFIIDRSGSMSSLVESTVAGCNETLDEYRQDQDEVLVSIFSFDDRYEAVVETTALEQVEPLVRAQVEPRGMTALLDAIGKTIDSTGQRLAAMDEDQRPGTVLVVVQTDGHENASKQYSLDQIKSMIQHQEQVYSWRFLFLAAGQDAIATGATMGFDAKRSLSYGSSAEGTDQAFKATKRLSKAYSAAPRAQMVQMEESTDAGLGFSAAERESAMADKGKSGRKRKS